MIKTITKTLLYLQVCTLIVLSPLAGPKPSPKSQPFHGSIEGNESYAPLQGDNLFTVGVGGGNASHLGRFTAIWHTVSQPFLPGNFGITTYELVAANGDSLFINAPGQGDASTYPVISIVETGTITGGTGRFEGASGTILTLRTITLSPDESTGVGSGAFSGTISLAKGK